MVRVDEVLPMPVWCLMLVEEIRTPFMNQDREGRGNPSAEQKRVVGCDEEIEVIVGEKEVIETWLVCGFCRRRPALTCDENSMRV